MAAICSVAGAEAGENQHVGIKRSGAWQCNDMAALANCGEISA